MNSKFTNLTIIFSNVAEIHVYNLTHASRESLRVDVKILTPVETFDMSVTKNCSYLQMKYNLLSVIFVRI